MLSNLKQTSATIKMASINTTSVRDGLDVSRLNVLNSLEMTF